MSGHTPGPWTINEAAANASHEIRGPDGEGVAYTGAWRTEHRAEQASNARLIAAAPDLLKALRRLVVETPFLPVSGGVEIIIGMEQLRGIQGALKKAEGLLRS